MIADRILELTGDVSVFNIATENVIGTQGEVFSACRRDNNVLYYMTDGARDYLNNGRKFLSIAPRSLMLLPFNSSYQTVSTGERGSVGLSIDFNLQNAAGEEIILDTLPQALLKDEDGYYIQKMQQIRKCILLGGLAQLKAKALLYDLLYTLATDQLRDRKSRESPSIQPAVRYMRTHLQTNCSIDQLAEMCFLSRSTFYRRFQEEYHTTPLLWHQQKRMEKCREMLLSGKYTVEEVASRMGFCDTGYFSRTFFRLTGMHAGDCRPSGARRRGNQVETKIQEK